MAAGGRDVGECEQIRGLEGAWGTSREGERVGKGLRWGAEGEGGSSP